MKYQDFFEHVDCLFVAVVLDESAGDGSFELEDAFVLLVVELLH
jgi:hypothetical protein